MEKSMSNEALKEHLSKIECLSKSATSKKHIEELISEITDYSASGDYSLKQPIVKSIIFLCMVILVVTFSNPSVWGEEHSFKIILIGGFTLIAFLLVYISRKGKVSSVGNDVFYKTVAVHNDLREEYDFDGYEMWLSLKGEFPVFNKGDEGQEISRLYKGKADDGTDFSLFEFKYVEVEEEEKEDSDGNKTTTTTRRTRYLQGCIVELVDFNAITINAGRYKEKWSSASKGFNNKFMVRCSNSVEAAKFFTPSAVLMFEDEFVVLKSLDVLENSKACLLLSDSVLPTNLKSPAINKTDEFISQLRNPQLLPSLQSAKK